MKKELPKVYEPQQVESRIYQMWEDNDCFNGDPDPRKKPFSIVMPPPNVTGQLHMGHALDCTLQDILTRFKRMQGYSTLWVPGTDHAGIATKGAEMTMEPTTPTQVSVSDAKKVMRLVDKLEELEDLQNVYHTMDITDEIAAALDEE